MDAVRAAGFITQKKTDELVNKIAQLAGSQRAEVLTRNTVEFNTMKSINENIYYSVYKRTHPDVKICFADNTTCWKCGQKMCSVYGLIDGNPMSPDFFNDSMLKISRGKGVLLEERVSGVTGETHLVNVCPHCGTFIGEFYLHDLWYGETETIQVDDVAEFIREKE